MSIYSYACPKCDEPVEVVHSVHDCDTERFCPFHAAEVMTRRAPDLIRFALKGANFSAGWNGPTVREVQRAMEDSPEYKSGKIRPVQHKAAW